MELEILAFIGSFLGVGCNIPQILKIIRTKETKAISLQKYYMCLLSQIIWLAFGILSSVYSMIFWGIIGVTLSLAVIFLKLSIEKTLEPKFAHLNGIIPVAALAWISYISTLFNDKIS